MGCIGTLRAVHSVYRDTNTRILDMAQTKQTTLPASNEEIRDWYDAHLTSATIASTARRFGRSREEILAILWFSNRAVRDRGRRFARRGKI